MGISSSEGSTYSYSGFVSLLDQVSYTAPVGPYADSSNYSSFEWSKSRVRSGSESESIAGSTSGATFQYSSYSKNNTRDDDTEFEGYRYFDSSGPLGSGTSRQTLIYDETLAYDYTASTSNYTVSIDYTAPWTLSQSSSFLGTSTTSGTITKNEDDSGEDEKEVPAPVEVVGNFDGAKAGEYYGLGAGVFAASIVEPESCSPNGGVDYEQGTNERPVEIVYDPSYLESFKREFEKKKTDKQKILNPPKPDENVTIQNELMSIGTTLHGLVAFVGQELLISADTAWMRFKCILCGTLSGVTAGTATGAIIGAGIGAFAGGGGAGPGAAAGGLAGGIWGGIDGFIRGCFADNVGQAGEEGLVGGVLSGAGGAAGKIIGKAIEATGGTGYGVRAIALAEGGSVTAGHILMTSEGAIGWAIGGGVGFLIGNHLMMSANGNDPTNVSAHGQQRQHQARQGDAGRQVGDPNRVIRQGKKYTDVDTGFTVYVDGNRVVILKPNGKRHTQFVNPKGNTLKRILEGKWVPIHE